MNMLELHKANFARQKEWDSSDAKTDLDFCSVELAGEVGEACNIIKKIERERLGMRGSRATLEDLADELGDVIICCDLMALHIGGIADPKTKIIWMRNKSLARLGSEMAAAAGMVCHAASTGNTKAVIQLLEVLIQRTDLIARSKNLDLDGLVKHKFNATSEKYNLHTRMI